MVDISTSVDHFTSPLAFSAHHMYIIISVHSPDNVNRLDPVLNVPEQLVCPLSTNVFHHALNTCCCDNRLLQVYFLICPWPIAILLLINDNINMHVLCSLVLGHTSLP